MFDEMGSSGGRLQDTVIAEASWVARVLPLATFVVAGALAMFVASTFAGAFVAFLFVVVGLAIDWRIRAMRLAVTTAGVHVVNFASEHTFGLDTVRLETEEEASQWPADDLPAAMKNTSGEEPKIGSLYLADGAGKRMKVAVAPSYGYRRITIVEDLKIAIARRAL